MFFFQPNLLTFLVFKHLSFSYIGRCQQDAPSYERLRDASVLLQVKREVVSKVGPTMILKQIEEVFLVSSHE